MKKIILSLLIFFILFNNVNSESTKNYLWKPYESLGIRVEFRIFDDTFPLNENIFFESENLNGDKLSNIIINNKEQNWYEKIRYIFVSEDWKNYAYVWVKNNKNEIIINWVIKETVDEEIIKMAYKNDLSNYSYNTKTKNNIEKSWDKFDKEIDLDIYDWSNLNKASNYLWQYISIYKFLENIYDKNYNFKKVLKKWEKTNEKYYFIESSNNKFIFVNNWKEENERQYDKNVFLDFYLNNSEDNNHFSYTVRIWDKYYYIVDNNIVYEEKAIYWSDNFASCSVNNFWEYICIKPDFNKYHHDFWDWQFKEVNNWKFIFNWNIIPYENNWYLSIKTDDKWTYLITFQYKWKFYFTKWNKIYEAPFKPTKYGFIMNKNSFFNMYQDKDNLYYVEKVDFKDLKEAKDLKIETFIKKDISIINNWNKNLELFWKKYNNINLIWNVIFWKEEYKDSYYWKKYKENEIISWENIYYIWEKENWKYIFWKNEKTSKEFDEILEYKFSENYQNFYFISKNWNNYELYKNFDKIKSYDKEMYNLTLSKNWEHFLFLVNEENNNIFQNIIDYFRKIYYENYPLENYDWNFDESTEKENSINIYINWKLKSSILGNKKLWEFKLDNEWKNFYYTIYKEIWFWYIQELFWNWKLIWIWLETNIFLLNNWKTLYSTINNLDISNENDIYSVIIFWDKKIDYNKKFQNLKIISYNENDNSFLAFWKDKNLKNISLIKNEKIIYSNLDNIISFWSNINNFKILEKAINHKNTNESINFIKNNTDYNFYINFSENWENNIAIWELNNLNKDKNKEKIIVIINWKKIKINTNDFENFNYNYCFIKNEINYYCEFKKFLWEKEESKYLWNKNIVKSELEILLENKEIKNFKKRKHFFKEFLENNSGLKKLEIYLNWEKIYINRDDSIKILNR